MHRIRSGAASVAACLALGLCVPGALAQRVPAQARNPAPNTQKTQTGPLGKHKKLLAPITHRNLTLIPVVATAAGPGKNYLVLDEGMQGGKVEIVEKQGGGQVSELVLRNKAGEPLFLMAGEVVVGGKQDRIIGKDTVIPANTEQAVPVFCVEHGRWQERRADFSTAKALAHTELRKKAKYESQQAVWDEVSKKNAVRKTSNATQTYKRLVQDKATKTSIAAYQKHFDAALARLPEKRKLVGFVVALNGQVMAIETFKSPTLFGKVKGKLLQSYYVEAVDRPTAKSVSAPDSKKIRAFRSKAQVAKRARKKAVLSGKAADTYNFDSADLKGSVVTEKKPAKAAPRAADEPAAAEAAEEDAIYESVYAN